MAEKLVGLSLAAAGGKRLFIRNSNLVPIVSPRKNRRQSARMVVHTGGTRHPPVVAKSLVLLGFSKSLVLWVRIPLSPPASPQPRILRLNFSALTPTSSTDSLVRVLASCPQA